MQARNTFETIKTKDGRLMDRFRIEHLPELIARVFDPEVRDNIGKEVMHPSTRDVIAKGIRQMDSEDTFYNRHNSQTIASMIREPRQDLMHAVEQYRDRIEELMPPDAAPRRRIRRGQEYGDSVDVDREICGIVECWDRSERLRTAQRQVTIAVNLSFNHWTKEADLIPLGGLAAAMVTQLQKRGIGVELIAVNASEGVTDRRDRREIVEITIKGAGETIDEATLATMCCDVGFVRAVMYLGSFTFNPERIASGWGSAESLARVMQVCDEVRYDFVIDGGIRTPEQGIEAINALIEKAKHG